MAKVIIKGMELYSKVPKETNGMPIIRRCNRIPQALIAFSEINRLRVPNDVAIHFFLYDQRFECVWNQCHRYTKVLCKHKFVLSPDFSAFMDMPIQYIAFNVLRSRLLGSWWQINGCDVIPTVTWAGVASYDVCFSGIESGGVVAVGACPKQDKRAANLWYAGMQELDARCKPSDILIYGCENEPIIDIAANIHCFKNPYITRMRRFEYGRKR